MLNIKNVFIGKEKNLINDLMKAVERKEKHV